MSKKLFLVLIIFVLFIPSLVSAGTYKCQDSEGNEAYAYYNGLVPCGRQVCIKQGGDWARETTQKIRQDLTEKDLTFNEACGSYGGEVYYTSCTGCHLLVMIDGIIDYLLIYIIPPIALLMIVLAGVMFYFSGSKPDLRKKASNTLKYTVIGLFLIYGSFMIVNLIFSLIGLASWTGLQGGWFSFECVPTVYGL